jgi:transposase-like protein
VPRLDGVVLARKTGAGALRRPVLVALGLRADGSKEIIDYRLATGESAAQWEQFLTDRYRRGLAGERLEMICVDGGQGLLAALPIVYPAISVQYCWAQTVRNILDKVRGADQPAIKAGLHAIMNAKTLLKARVAARRFAARWEAEYEKAVRGLRDDLDERLTCWRDPTLEQRKRSEPPMPSSDAAARSAAAPDPWVSSRTEPPWTTSSSPSSPTKTQTRECRPSSP